MSQVLEFEIDPLAAEKLNQGMNMQGGIELPFAAPVFWWMNGNSQFRAMAQANPAAYFGGWAMKEEAALEVEPDRGPVPAGLIKAENVTRDGTPIQVYTSRFLVVAPISYRSGWVSGDSNGKTRQVGYMPGAKKKIQVIAIMGVKQGESYRSWGPIMLTAQGYQVDYMISAMKDWKKAIERTRRTVAPNIPPWAFYMTLGTFGDSIKTMMVGKPGSQSPITPINTYIPKDITPDLLRKIYVGKDCVNEMVDCLEDAKEWLEAWKHGEHLTQAQSAGPEHDGFFPDEEPMFEEEIPF